MRAGVEGSVFYYYYYCFERQEKSNNEDIIMCFPSVFLSFFILVCDPSLEVALGPGKYYSSLLVGQRRPSVRWVIS